MTLCDYKNAFGKPREGLRKYRIGDLAAADLLFTAAGAYSLSRLGGWPFLAVLIVLIVVAVFVHEAFCVDTAFNAFLFGRRIVKREKVVTEKKPAEDSS